jgi:hypothetical protein
MEDLTPMEQTAETISRLLAAVTTLATAAMMPEGEELLLTAFCAMIDPAEA